MKYEHIAKIAHEANKAYSQTIGDYSHKSWEDAPDAQRESSIIGVKQISENPNIDPEELHESWMQTKIAQGYVYGEKKDDKLKTHDCLLPYNQLPASQRIKDYLYRSIVLTLIEFVDE